MQMFRSSQFRTWMSQNPKKNRFADHHGLSTTMSQNHEITKLHIFPCHSWNNYDTFQLQIQIVDGILTNNVNALNCTIHCNADCNVIVNVPRRQRRLQQPINSSRTNVNTSPEHSHPLSRWMKVDQSLTHRVQHEFITAVYIYIVQASPSSCSNRRSLPMQPHQNT